MPGFTSTAALLAAAATLVVTSSIPRTQVSPMMLRIAEIEVGAEDVDAYRAILKDESEASVRLEPGVLAIFPMFEAERPTQVRILEIYASRAAYEAHLQSPHFRRYKESTQEMVKSLELVEMRAIDAESMARIFRKVP